MIGLIRSQISSPKALVQEGAAGFAAMLVALPSAVAYGVTTYAVFGPEFAAQGAIAGVVGAAVMGLIAPALGGAPRLITAPCAPAAAVLAALATQLIRGGQGGAPMTPDQVVLLLTFVALLSGSLQFLYGVIGGGRLIKYIPFPVVSGYLSGVGLLILSGQLKNVFAWPKETTLGQGLLTPSSWQVPTLIVGAVTIAAMFLAPKLTRAVPAPIIGLAAGMTVFLGLRTFAAGLFRGAPEQFVVGQISGGIAAVGATVATRWSALGNMQLGDVSLLATQAITLSVLLSIDTLKTCVVVDALTRSRHNSNRELIGQGVANVASAFVGGLPGAGTMGATLVNVNSGGKTPVSALLEGIFVALTFLLFGSLIGAVPLAALAGILIVVALKMVDRSSLHLLRQKSTIFDFVVILAVVIVAVTINLIAAAGAGLALSIVLFIREQIRGSVIRRKLHGDQISSKQHRLQVEREILREHGSLITACQLQGSLFFGTTDQLFKELESDLKQSRYVILDMTRVQTVDFTAAHMLEQVEAVLKERDGVLIFTNLPPSLPSGQDLEAYFNQLELVAPTQKAKVFGTFDEALEWAEDQVLELYHAGRADDEQALDLAEIDLVREVDAETLKIFRECVTEWSYKPGERIFKMGDESDTLLLIRRGIVRILIPLDAGRYYNITSFAQGDFFGDMAFLDRGVRSADAVAVTAVDLYVLSRKRFNDVSRQHPAFGAMVFARLARALALRLRHTDTELRALQES